MPRKPAIAQPKPPPDAGVGKRGRAGHIAYLLRQAHGAVRYALDNEFTATGLTTPQFLVLNLLNAYPGASGAEIARIAQLTPQTLNLIVRKLERDELIEREQHETHGRVLRMSLTASGREKLAQCKRLADALERRLLNLLNEDSELVVRQWLTQVAVELS
jgi:DNA-binding MarR family transcriptional regulator